MDNLLAMTQRLKKHVIARNGTQWSDEAISN
ncbi:hypothetical protein RCH13_000852 [Chryseobacterium sp. MP_3.2]|nr:hypothetical protein [Chryseobacterium sp. MP_3.2]